MLMTTMTMMQGHLNIIAWVLFLAIKGIMKLKKEEPAAPAPGPTAEVKLLTEIRDLLKNERPARIIPA
jgi:large conductance mechanosensitive channel